MTFSSTFSNFLKATVQKDNYRGKHQHYLSVEVLCFQSGLCQVISSIVSLTRGSSS